MRVPSEEDGSSCWAKARVLLMLLSQGQEEGLL